MRTFILADNQDITRIGMLSFINDMPGLASNILEAKNKKELTRLLLAHPDAVIILDYVLFDLAGIEDMIITHERFHRTDWILISSELTETFIRHIYHNKAFSILLKEIQADEIKRALLQSVRSEQYICRQISNLIQSYNPDKQNNRQNLTHTETEILKLIARGYSTKEIATQRISSVHTIITHKKNIFRKLEVNTVYEATKYALKAGLIDSAEYYI